MGNDKKSMMALLVVTIAAVGICAGAIVFLKEDSEEKVILDEKKVEKPKEVVKVEEEKEVTKVIKTEPKLEVPLTEEEKIWFFALFALQLFSISHIVLWSL